jgi:MoaE-MoaD fusion protein
VGELRDLLVARYPTLGELWPRLAVAVDGELAEEEALLSEGAEVALLPPVSGGGPSLPALVEGPIDPRAAVAAVGSASRGAVVLFLGSVRDHHRGLGVRGLTYAAYRPMAVRRLEAIVRELEAAAPGVALAIQHRLGHLAPGEASVVIAVGAPHREAAYTASRLALERLKREVPIWKREHYQDGSVAWREEEPLGSPEALPR